MTIFDTDIASDLLQSRPAVVARAASIPAEEQAITIVTVEEILRGRLNLIRQAEAGKIKTPLEKRMRCSIEVSINFVICESWLTTLTLN